MGNGDFIFNLSFRLYTTQTHRIMIEMCEFPLLIELKTLVRFS